MTRQERFARWLLGDLVYEVVQLLKRPEEWRCYLGTLTHKTGITVWCNNSTYGVDIAITPSLVSDDSKLKWSGARNIWLHEYSIALERDMLWGSVTMLSAVGLSIKHHVIWHYAKRVRSYGGRNT